MNAVVRALCAVLVVFLAGCGAPAPTVLRTPAVPVNAPFRAGGYYAAARVADITPPLHLSLFGHGPESRVATGVRLRLRCEAFVIASAGEVIALVPCDLQSSSEALQRAVAERLVKAGVPINADRLFVMATHTHMAPAHYFDARRYSGTFSSMLPGFDPRVLGFLADRIAEQVKAAYDELKPACLGWTQANIADSQLSLNRAYVPFLANAPLRASDPVAQARHADASQERAAMKQQGAPPASRGAEMAVDATLSVLRLDRREAGAVTCDASAPLGVFAVFGMHPTGIPNTNSLYHGDIFGYAVRAAEGALTRPLPLPPGVPARDAAWNTESAAPGDRRVVVGLANGVDGDVSPRLDDQSDTEARRVGRVLGARIVEVAQDRTALQASGTVDHLYRELRFSSARYDDDPAHLLCEYGELGAVSAGGARDGPTRLRIVPEMNAGFIPDQFAPCHDAKLALRAGKPTDWDYPRIGAIALVRVGNGVLATAPGELTTMTGLRIHEALGESLPTDAKVALVGLTNHYLQYFATPEEYRFQYYEGASTLYGPHSQPFLTRHYGYLGALLRQRWSDAPSSMPVEVPPLPPDMPDQVEVNRLLPFDLEHTGPNIHRWPDAEEPEGERAATPVVTRVRRRGAWGYELVTAGLPPLFTSQPSDFYVRVLEGDVVRDDHMGASVELQELDDGHWRIRWIPDLSECDARCGKTYRIAVGGKVSFVSAPFTTVCAEQKECAP